METFANMLEVDSALSLDEQEQLSDTLRRRVNARRRMEIIASIKEARKEHSDGRVRASSVVSIMKRIRA